MKKILPDLKLLYIHSNATDTRKEIITKTIAVKEEYNIKIELVKKEKESVKKENKFVKKELSYK